MKLKYQLLLLIVVLISSCRSYQQAQSVEDGILYQGLAQKAFLAAWGPPDYTRIVSFTNADETLSVQWNSGGGELFKGRSRSYQEWEYKNLGVKLLFNHNKLVGWNTDKSTAELKALGASHKQLTKKK
jgi:hypothetical protein